MYALPVSLLCLPPPRRRVNREIFCSCGEGTPARAAPAERGRPEATVWQILAALNGRVNWGAAIPLRGAVPEYRCACGAGDAGENQFFEVKL
jgi:hypothetical protein